MIIMMYATVGEWEAARDDGFPWDTPADQAWPRVAGIYSTVNNAFTAGIEQMREELKFEWEGLEDAPEFNDLLLSEHEQDDEKNYQQWSVIDSRGEVWGYIVTREMEVDK